MALTLALAPVRLVWAGAPPPTDGTVMVWPADATDDTTEVEQALISAGHTVVPFAPIADSLRTSRAQERDAAGVVLASVEADLARAQEHYLAQSWDEMVDGLARAEDRALSVLARPEACGALWEFEFRRGLGLGARNGEGDVERRLEHFALAFTIDRKRRPLGDLYGPDVAAAFLGAVEAVNAHTARPTALELSPADARLTIDCVPVPDGAPVSLPPGLHVVLVEAPGYQPHAAVIDLVAGAPLSVTLAPDVTDDPVRRVAVTWPGTRLVPHGAASVGAIEGIAADRGVDRWVALSPSEGGTRAELWHAGRRISTVHDARASSAAVTVLRPVPLVGPAVPPPAVVVSQPPGDGDTPKPLVRKWWFWTAIAGGVAATGLGLGLGLGLRDETPDRLQITVR